MEQSARILKSVLTPKKSRKLKFGQSHNIDQEEESYVHITKFRKLDCCKDVNTDEKENVQDQSNIPSDHLIQHEHNSSTSSSESLNPDKVEALTPAASTRPGNHGKPVTPPFTFMISGQSTYRI